MNPQAQQPPEEDEVDSDYDIFASVRPKGISVDNNPADEANGEDLDPYADVRPREGEIQKSKEENKKPKTHTYGEMAKDWTKQAAKETLIGIGGVYGDLISLAGPDMSVDTDTEKNLGDVETLKKMREPGYKPSIYDLASLESDDGPDFRLPTSKNLRDVNELAGGPGEPETMAGRYGQRQGRIYGAGVAFGQVNPLPALAAGASGQTVEELNGGPLLQAAAEISTLLLTQGRSKGSPLNKTLKQETADKVNELRNLGYTDEQITLAVNAASRTGKTRAKRATKGASTEEAFENFAEHSQDLIGDILTQGVPGIERGTAHVHEMASQAYGHVAQQASNITITKPRPFLDAAQNVVDQLRNTLGRNPEAESFITRLSAAAIDATQFPSAEAMMNFYKELNGMGKWLGRSQKDRLITQVKNGIKDTFRGEGKAGQQLATQFEEVNLGIQKAYQAEEVYEILQKSMTQDGYNFNKLYKSFDNPENVHLMEGVLGVQQTRNLNLIAKTGKEVKDFDKAWKGATPFLKGSGTDIVTNASAAYYLYQMDFAGLAKVLTAKIGKVGVAKLAEKSLTDPAFQNLLIRGIHAVGRNTPQTLKVINDEIGKYIDAEEKKNKKG